MSETGGHEALRARVALLTALSARSYNFVTPRPATHARVVARKGTARDLRDVFGWSLPFAPGAVDAEIVGLLEACGALEKRGDLLASAVRVSSLDDLLFLHSAYPTRAQDAVFFGPDSYRFAAFLQTELPALAPRKSVWDIGAGSGVGAIVTTRILEPETCGYIDTNPLALEYAMANAHFAGLAERGAFIRGEGLGAITDRADLIIANPPYIADPLHRAYRDGGGMHGGEISLRWAEEAADKLDSGGALLLYTGSAIVKGEDRLKAALLKALRGFDISYREIDPDVFGEELEREDYADVERIAVVGLVAVKR